MAVLNREDGTADALGELANEVAEIAHDYKEAMEEVPKEHWMYGEMQRTATDLDTMAKRLDNQAKRLRGP